MLALVAVLQWMFPGLMSEAASRMRAQPWSNLGLGIAIALIASAIVGLLFASIIGIPLGGTLALAIAIAWIFGLSAVSLCIGLAIRRLVGRTGDVGGRAGDCDRLRRDHAGTVAAAADGVKRATAIAQTATGLYIATIGAATWPFPVRPSSSGQDAALSRR
jgi:hypothetical protein